MRCHPVKAGYFYKILCTDLKQPEEQGGGTREGYKFCLAVLAGQSAGFFVNTKPRYTRARDSRENQIEILPQEINSRLPHDASRHHRLKHTSYLDLSKLQRFKEVDVSSAEEICEMPQPIVQKTVDFLKKSMEGEPQPDSTIPRAIAKKVVCSLEDCLIRRPANKL